MPRRIRHCQDGGWRAEAYSGAMRFLVSVIVVAALAACEKGHTLEIGPARVYLPNDWEVGSLHGEAPTAASDLVILNAEDPEGRASVMISLGKGSMESILAEQFTPEQRAPLREIQVNGRRALRGTLAMGSTGPDEPTPAREALFVDYGTHVLMFAVFHEGALDASARRTIERILAAGPALPSR